MVKNRAAKIRSFPYPLLSPQLQVLFLAGVVSLSELGGGDQAVGAVEPALSLSKWHVPRFRTGYHVPWAAAISEQASATQRLY